MKEINPRAGAFNNVFPFDHYSNRGDCKKVSQFALLLRVDNQAILINTLSLQCFLLTREEYSLLQALESQIDFKNPKIIDTQKLPTYLYEELRDSLFIVPESIDEIEEYKNFIEILKLFKPQNNGLHNYIILPTTACNARCYYCFEIGRKYITMNTDVEEEVIRYIEKTHEKKRSIKLQWFGGEPLIGVNTIRNISKAVSNLHIPYEADLVTNGSLATGEIVDEAVKIWNVKSTQITLDGLEEEHNRRKAYVKDSENGFKKAIEAIHLFQDAGIRVAVRINVDPDTVGTVPKLIDFLSREFSQKERLTVYVTSLFQAIAQEMDIDYFKQLAEVREYVGKCGFTPEITYRLDKVKVDFCMASNPGKSIVIAPDGKLYRCTDYVEDSEVGTIWKGEKKVITGVSEEKMFIIEKCANCVFLPSCTSFRECPHSHINCKKSKQVRLESQLRMLLHSLEREEE